MKTETRVYLVDLNVVDLEDARLEDINNRTIDRWAVEVNETGVLPTMAADFITIAEDLGTVYTLDSFMRDFNGDYLGSSNSYIFITDKY